MKVIVKTSIRSCLCVVLIVLIFRRVCLAQVIVKTVVGSCLCVVLIVLIFRRVCLAQVLSSDC
mgnify:CR=1 FL=1